MGRIDKHLGRNTVEKLLDALPKLTTVDHVNVQIAGEIGISAHNGTGDDDTKDIKSLQDEAYRLTQSLIAFLREIRPDTLVQNKLLPRFSVFFRVQTISSNTG